MIGVLKNSKGNIDGLDWHDKQRLVHLKVKIKFSKDKVTNTAFLNIVC